MSSGGMPPSWHMPAGTSHIHLVMTHCTRVSSFGYKTCMARCFAQCDFHGFDSHLGLSDFLKAFNALLNTFNDWQHLCQVGAAEKTKQTKQDVVTRTIMTSHGNKCID